MRSSAKKMPAVLTPPKLMPTKPGQSGWMWKRGYLFRASLKLPYMRPASRPTARGTRTLIAASLALGTVAWYSGREIHYPGRPPTIYTALACVSVGTSLIGRRFPGVDSICGKSGEPIGVLRPITIRGRIIYFGPFLSVHEVGEAVVAVAVLLPSFAVPVKAILEAAAQAGMAEE